MSCIYIYYPNKPIPIWLVEIRFLEAQLESNPHIAHGGFGIVISSKGKYYAYLLKGPFIRAVRCNDYTFKWNENLHMRSIGWY